MELSIVIPTFNSELYIQQFLKDLAHLSLLNHNKVEIIIVDDGSTDNTEDKVREFISNQLHIFRYIKLPKNIGQKASIFMGLQLSKGRYALTLDDDLQYSNADIEAIFKKIKDSELWIVGSKSNYKPSKKYELLKKIVFFLFGLFFKKYIKAGYFSAFKIYDLEKLKANDIENVFFFWNIPTHKIDAIHIEKKRGIRNYSNYNFINFLKLTSTILLRAIYLFSIYIGIPISIFLLFIFETFTFLAAFILLIFIVLLLLKIEKINYSKLAENFN